MEREPPVGDEFLGGPPCHNHLRSEHTGRGRAPAKRPDYCPRLRGVQSELWQHHDWTNYTGAPPA